MASIFTFHELPPPVRRIVFGEFAWVLKPGGRLILIDSLQRADEPDYEALLELFAQSFHEPYFNSYLEEDFGAIAKKLRAGARQRDKGVCFEGDGLRQTCFSIDRVSALTRRQPALWLAVDVASMTWRGGVSSGPFPWVSPFSLNVDE